MRAKERMKSRIVYHGHPTKSITEKSLRLLGIELHPAVRRSLVHDMFRHAPSEFLRLSPHSYRAGSGQSSLITHSTCYEAPHQPRLIHETHEGGDALNKRHNQMSGERRCLAQNHRHNGLGSRAMCFSSRVEILVDGCESSDNSHLDYGQSSRAAHPALACASTAYVCREQLKPTLPINIFSPWTRWRRALQAPKKYHSVFTIAHVEYRSYHHVPSLAASCVWEGVKAHLCYSATTLTSHNLINLQFAIL